MRISSVRHVTDKSAALSCAAVTLGALLTPVLGGVALADTPAQGAVSAATKIITLSADDLGIGNHLALTGLAGAATVVVPAPRDLAPQSLVGDATLTLDAPAATLEFQINNKDVEVLHLKPGTGEYVQATGGDGDSRAMGQLFYVSDAGVRYHIKDLPTAAALGMTGVHDPRDDADVPQLAPWPVVSLLPAGPELSQEAALGSHDGMGADPRGSKVEPPRS